MSASSVATRRRVRVSNRKILLVLVPAASVRSSGLSAMVVISSSPRSVPSAAGLLSSAASRLPRVCDRVVERDALTRQQQRAVQVILDEGARAEPLSVGRDRLLVRCAALLERDDGGDHRQYEQRRDAREHGAQAALGALRRRTTVV